jgi:hypothetical protein
MGSSTCRAASAKRPPIFSNEALATYAGDIQPRPTIVDAKFPGAALLGAMCRVREKLPA